MDGTRLQSVAQHAAQDRVEPLGALIASLGPMTCHGYASECPRPVWAARSVTPPRRTCARSLTTMNCRGPATLCRLSVLIAAVCLVSPSASAQQPQGVPKFRAGVAVVPITAVVRDSRGRLVGDLSRDDFEVLENGRPRPIVEFRSTGHTPMSLALLFDTSGSMRDANLEQGKSVVESLLGRMEWAWDEMALVTFDGALREKTPFTNQPEVIRTALAKTVAWGQTALYRRHRRDGETTWRATNPAPCGRGHHRRRRYQQHAHS